MPFWKIGKIRGLQQIFFRLFEQPKIPRRGSTWTGRARISHINRCAKIKPISAGKSWRRFWKFAGAGITSNRGRGFQESIARSLWWQCGVFLEHWGNQGFIGRFIGVPKYCILDGFPGDADRRAAQVHEPFARLRAPPLWSAPWPAHQSRWHNRRL